MGVKCVCTCNRTNMSLASRCLVFSSCIVGFLSPFHQQWIGRVFNPLDFNLLIVNSHCCQGTSHFFLWNTDITALKRKKIWIWGAMTAQKKKTTCQRFSEKTILVGGLTLTSSHVSFSSFRTRLVCRGVCGTSIDCYSHVNNHIT